MNQKSIKFKSENKDARRREGRKLMAEKPIDEKLLKKREQRVDNRVIKLYKKILGRGKLTSKLPMIESLRRTNTLIAREALMDVRLSNCDIYLKEWARKGIIELDKILRENA